jgi:C4-dicarboxylate transporter DctM subunit
VQVVLPALIAADVNLIYMNVILVLSMQIAQVTPPFGISLYVTAGIMGVPIFKVVRACLPFLGVLIVSLAILLAFPQISLFLPELMTK